MVVKKRKHIYPIVYRLSMNKQVQIENEDKIKLTQKQKRLVVKIVKGHVEDKNYVFHSASVYVCKYFVSLYFSYYPKDDKIIHF